MQVARHSLALCASKNVSRSFVHPGSSAGYKSTAKSAVPAFGPVKIAAMKDCVTESRH
jgi:hypothetical protein